MKVKTLLIGLGQIGFMYDLNFPENDYIMTHARALINDKRFELVAAVDPSKDKRDLFTLKYGIVSYPQVDIALANVSPDVVIVANPTESHLVTIESLVIKESIKLIVCEKPLAYSLTDANKIVELCGSYKKYLIVNYMRRTNQYINKGIEYIKAKGTMVNGVIRYSGGMIHNGTHFLDLMIYHFGEIADYELIRKKKIPNDWFVDFFAVFERANIYFLSSDEASFDTPLVFHEIDLYSSNGRVLMHNGASSIKLFDVANDEDFPDIKTYKERPEIQDKVMQNFQKYVVNDIYQWFVSGKGALTIGGEALGLLRLTTRICED